MFQSIHVTEAELSGFHLMTVTVLRNIFKKLRPTVINYGPYLNFINGRPRASLINNLLNKVLLKYSGEKKMVIVLQKKHVCFKLICPYKEEIHSW